MTGASQQHAAIGLGNGTGFRHDLRPFAVTDQNHTRARIGTQTGCPCGRIGNIVIEAQLLFAPARVALAPMPRLS
jgi:hypothetical protein